MDYKSNLYKFSLQIRTGGGNRTKIFIFAIFLLNIKQPMIKKIVIRNVSICTKPSAAADFKK
jgi:hypothetical protein